MTFVNGRNWKARLTQRDDISYLFGSYNRYASKLHIEGSVQTTPGQDVLIEHDGEYRPISNGTVFDPNPYVR